MAAAKLPSWLMTAQTVLVAVSTPYVPSKPPSALARMRRRFLLRQRGENLAWSPPFQIMFLVHPAGGDTGHTACLFLRPSKVGLHQLERIEELSSGRIAWHFQTCTNQVRAYFGLVINYFSTMLGYVGCSRLKGD